MTVPLPVVLVSSVVRSAHQGDSHGGVYLVDLDDGRCEQVVDWNTVNIDWSGRGADRGLRGIAFHGDRVCIAASDEVFIFDQGFRIVGSFRNRFLKHCHEICVVGDRLYLASTGFDCVLELDLAARRFLRGTALRAATPGAVTARAEVFDPEGPGGPLPGDTVHINNVHAGGDGTVFFSAHRLPSLFTLGAGPPETYATIPTGTHNARPFHWQGRDLVIANCTKDNSVRLMDRGGLALREFNVKLYAESELLNAHLPKDHARQGFARGLCVLGDGLICAGSSPSTVSVYNLHMGGADPVKCVNLTMDVRNAVHGLVAWPFGPCW
jgi:hypothetical protein